MSGPFIFVATNRLRDGRFDAEQQRVPALSSFIEAHEPRLIALNEYVNEERSGRVHARTRAGLRTRRAAMMTLMPPTAATWRPVHPYAGGIR
jgi:hypothetical protein